MRSNNNYVQLNNFIVKFLVSIQKDVPINFWKSEYSVIIPVYSQEQFCIHNQILNICFLYSK